MSSMKTAATAAALLTTNLVGATLPPVQDGQRGAHPDWTLGRGATNRQGITNILSGPAMAFYVQDAKSFTKMFESKEYQEFIKAHPELKINNPYADATVAKHLKDFEALMARNPNVAKRDLPEWDSRCEVVSNASAKHFAHFINIQLVQSGKPPFNFGTDGAKMRGTQKGDWMDGTFGKFLKTPDGQNMSFKLPNGQTKTLQDLYIGWCRAQLAQTQKVTGTPDIPKTPPVEDIPPPETTYTPPQTGQYGVPPIARDGLADPSKQCIDMVVIIDGKLYQGVQPPRGGIRWGFGIPFGGGGGGGFACPPLGCLTGAGL